MTEKLVLDWQTFHKACKRLAQIIPLEKYDGLVAVTRGGLVPAAILSNDLDIRLIETIGVQSYQQQQQGDLQLVKPAYLLESELIEPQRWLFVEDLVDSGCTIKFLKQFYPRADFACVYAKPQGAELVKYSVEQVAQDIWIDFPWEI
ncbi:xanthine-guanine phosphoribosyltransferase [Catenovulum agarivorans DS-2]|uniref:Xanthine-guanine phosphoribosyltransferase n=1 Tax=Catenovulum agarivorans DS-2 TaxID=1328313 RepID=W7QLU6_9ALTE|nr:xanthine phosphoribosyltransferase [Catenovulum agarivorans]EWH09917.1 xanthine-guanine phosphoribosyltransferase [Catenovulum agarivorans DS-2]